MSTVHVGTAGWSLPAAEQRGFPGEGTHLERYARRFGAAEINSSFYRPHRASTWAKWAGSVPESFRFSVKVPRAITHTLRLANAAAPLDEFLTGPAAMGARLGCVLVQLPPSLALDAPVADAFFAALRGRWAGSVACEPRHASWFGAEGAALLDTHRVARVAADPARVPAAAEPGGWPGLVYYRLHGSPRIYYSAYDEPTRARTADALRASAAAGAEAWCIFDNTAAGAATGDALDVDRRVADPG